jgi:hypothetical protein
MLPSFVYLPLFPVLQKSPTSRLSGVVCRPPSAACYKKLFNFSLLNVFPIQNRHLTLAQKMCKLPIIQEVNDG